MSTLLLLAEIPAALAWDVPGGYDVAQRAVSDLGATTCTSINYADGAREVCSPLHLLVNGSWVLSGALLALGALLLRPRLPGRSGTASIIGFVVGGASLVATGLVPVDVDLSLHLLVAFPSFLMLNLALLLAAGALGPSRAGLRRAALILGTLGLLGGAATLAWAFIGGPLGVYERVSVYAAPLWVLMAGISWGRRPDAHRAVRL